MSRRIFLAALALAAAAAIEAVPAYRGALKATQPDGSVITFYLHGDEHSHVCVSADGYRLLQDAAGAYRYASLTTDGKLSIAGSPLAHDPQLRGAGERTYVKGLKLSRDIKVKTTPAVTKSPAAPAGASRRFQVGSYPTIGEGRCLVLMVEFADKQFSLDKTWHDRMLNETGFSNDGATGCAVDYFKAQSSGLFSPTFDVTGPIRLSHNVSYYGQDDAYQGKDVNVGKMISEACKLAHDNYGVDFSKYDGDGDGLVDMVYVIYAGYGQHAGGGANTIWPHKYQLSGFGIDLKLDGKTIDTYACSSELFGNSGTVSSGIGTICHEFGHVLGLADHYNTTDATDYKLGSYDIMDYGSYNNNGHTPAAYNAFERISLGWMTPDTLSTKRKDCRLEYIGSSNRACVITTTNPDEFYLLENRQQRDWDRYIPSSGLMITHVDYSQSVWQNNTVNDDSAHPRFAIVPADNELGYDAVKKHRTEEYDLYPIASNDAFTDHSTPAARPYTGETLDKGVTSIYTEDGLVGFDFRANHLDIPSGIVATVDSDNGFTARWNASDEASAYTLRLHRLALASMQPVALSEGFAAMTAASADDISAQLDRYTQKSGWTGENVFQTAGWCQVGKENKGGRLTTPELNLKRFDGEYTVAVTAKSATGKQPVLSVKSNGQEGRTRITSTARTYVFKFKGGISHTSIDIATNSERAFIDTITVARGTDAVFAGAREIAVSGTPEITEGEIDDKDFVNVDTVTVDNVIGTGYSFTGLEARTWYAFSVKALGSDAGSNSDWSPATLVYTDRATGIGSTPATTADGRRMIYTMDGRHTTGTAARGLYIVRENGRTRKIMITK